jgi:hypothetical protein
MILNLNKSSLFRKLDDKFQYNSENDMQRTRPVIREKICKSDQINVGTESKRFAQIKNPNSGQQNIFHKKNTFKQKAQDKLIGILPGSIPVSKKL